MTSATGSTPTTGSVRLGLRENIAQFTLLVVVNALVGGMIGQERTVLPLLADRTFGLTAFTATTTFVVAFGATKALTNLVTGALADRVGRKPILVIGWLVGAPVPLLLIWAPSWAWVIVANVLLGVNQGMTWSATVIMKVDLVGPARRGLALGLNEAAGYGAVAVTALATGEIAAAHGLRPEPFYLGIAFAAIGLGLSSAFVRETRQHAVHEAASADASNRRDARFRVVFARTSWTDPSLAAVSQAGLVNNAVDGLAWGILPLLFASEGLSVGRIGVLAALYPGVWCVGQLFAGAWSDRVGRKPLIVAGMLLQGAALALMARGTGFGVWAVGAVLVGAGTALVYPTLIAAVSDVAHPTWRATAIGVYRLWRDAGYVVGGLVGGIVADVVDLRAAVWVIAALSVASALVVIVRMKPATSTAGGTVPDMSAEATITGVHHFSPTVSDVEASAAWYEKVFSMTRVPVTFAHHEREDTGYAVLLLDPASGLAIGLHHNTANQGESFDEARTGLDHIGFSVPTRESLEAWVTKLDGLGIAHTGIRDITDPIPFSTLVFRDPDNIQLEFIYSG